MNDYKSKQAFDMLHNKEANFTNLSNRPQGPIKQTNNGGPAEFENNRNNKNPDAAKIKSAVKSGATVPAGGGAFKKFVGQ